MNASRRDWRRALDYSAVKDPNAITNVIAGLLSRRINPMRAKEICHWFYATPDAFINQALDIMLERGQVKAGGSSLSRNRRVLTYWVDTRDE